MFIIGCIGDAAAPSLTMVLTWISSGSARRHFINTRHPCSDQQLVLQAAQDLSSFLELATWLFGAISVALDA